LRHWALIAIAYLAGSLLFLWPMPMAMDSAIWGDRFDAWTTLWLIGHLAEGLEQGNLSATTTDILYPLGYSLWSFGHMALQAIGALMVWAGLGLVQSYNCLLIGGIWTSALAAHLLGRELTGSHVAGAVAGTVFASSPYLYAEGAAGCIELVAAGLLPLHAWSLVRLCKAPSWRRCLVAACVLAIIGPFNWYYTLFAGVFGLGFCAWQVAAAGRKIRHPSREAHRRAVGLMLLSMAMAALIDLPLIDAAQQETPSRPPISAEMFSDNQAWERSQAIADGTAPIEELTLPRLEELDAMQVHLNSTSLLGLIQARFSVNPLGITPGALAYGAAFLGLLVGGRRTWGWLVLAGAFTVLTLGPYLNPEGSLSLHQPQVQFSLPYAWLYAWLPFFSKAYRPYRFAVVVLQCLAVIAAIGAGVLVRQLGPRWTGIGAGLLGIVGFSQPHWAGDVPANRSLMDARVPALYSALAKEPEGAVIELPLHYQPVSIAAAKQQTYQLAHGHPLLNTNQLIRRPDLLAFRDLVADNSFLRVLLDLGRTEPPLRVRDSDIAAVQAMGFRYLVVHDQVPGDAQHLAGERVWADLVTEPARTMLRTLMGDPIIQTPTGQVYDLNQVDLQAGRTRTWTGEEIEHLQPPFDTAQTGFTLRLKQGDGVDLHYGTARQISLWARPAGEQSGQLEIHAIGESDTQVQQVRLHPNTWTRTALDLSDLGPSQIRLIAGPDGTEVSLTRMLVLR
jgi:hypothetical protein